MKFGIGYFPTDEGVDPATLARLTEERGFESLFFTDHTHIPASRESPWPGGEVLPREYGRLYDPFVAMMAAAAATERIMVGTGVCLVIERDPIATAKQVASVDRLSGGRLLFGVGAGWNLEEMRNHGTDPDHRFRAMRERVEAMKEIWTCEEATYNGRHVSFDKIWAWPKPLTDPHPPVLIGGLGPRVLDRVIAYGDEWFPIRTDDDEALVERMRQLQTAAAQKDCGPKPVTISSSILDPAALELFEAAGANRAVYWVPQSSAEEAERRLDEIAATAEEYQGWSVVDRHEGG
ncbi:MAG: LLM class F420-dependent oxidoreductase [Solirubrobacterales bacterium]|nr:LLM class F420-dependent oxidoreductase [Solirubrobacterales bacterium]